MSDRSSAQLFRKIFILLSLNPTEDNKLLAQQIALMTKDYDFTKNQMRVDEELVILGLAKVDIVDGFKEKINEYTYLF